MLRLAIYELEKYIERIIYMHSPTHYQRAGQIEEGVCKLGPMVLLNSAEEPNTKVRRRCGIAEHLLELPPLARQFIEIRFGKPMCKQIFVKLRPSRQITSEFCFMLILEDLLAISGRAACQPTVEASRLDGLQFGKNSMEDRSE